jgi:hypothetical protein
VGISVHSEASVIGITRTLHDSKECHCRFMVNFEHDETEVILTFEHLFRYALTVIIVV